MSKYVEVFWGREGKENLRKCKTTQSELNLERYDK